MIDQTRKIVFIHIPKAAGFGVVERLCGKYDRGSYKYLNTDTGEWSLFGINEDHATLQEAKLLLGKESWSDFYKFTIIRNPYDRMVSVYHHFKKHKTVWWKPTFEEFIDFYFSDRRSLDMDHYDHQLRMGMPMKYWIDDVSEFDYVIRFEDLQSGFLKVCADLGIPQKKLKKTNKSKRNKPTREYYTPRLQEMMINEFMDDFSIFEYSTDLP